MVPAVTVHTVAIPVAAVHAVTVRAATVCAVTALAVMVKLTLQACLLLVTRGQRFLRPTHARCEKTKTSRVYFETGRSPLNRNCLLRQRGLETGHFRRLKAIALSGVGAVSQEVQPRFSQHVLVLGNCLFRETAVKRKLHGVPFPKTAVSVSKNGTFSSFFFCHNRVMARLSVGECPSSVSRPAGSTRKPKTHNVGLDPLPETTVPCARGLACVTLPCLGVHGRGYEGAFGLEIRWLQTLEQMLEPHLWSYLRGNSIKRGHLRSV